MGEHRGRGGYVELASRRNENVRFNARMGRPGLFAAVSGELMLVVD